MTKAELDRQINDINQSNDSTENKARRIDFLKKVYADYQTRTAAEAKQKQQAAEFDLKARLKSSYMQNPVATADDFERDYPAMKSDYLRNEAIKNDAAARESQARLIQSSF